MGAAAVDVTLPGRAQQVGTRHLINGIIDEVSDIFLGLGYKVVEGEEIETDYYNFTALNAPADHPSRSMQDTFYVHDLSGDTSRVRGESDVLLRTQTSGVQVHVMEDWDLPIYMIAPGKVYPVSYTHLVCSIDGPDVRFALEHEGLPYRAALTESCARKLQADFIVTHGGEVSVSRAVRRVAPDELFSVLEAEQGIVFDVIDF